jgi:iron complex transport system ATP-binding protein
VTRLAQQGRTFLITSHSPNNALLYAGRVLVMKNRQILADGEPGRALTGGLLSEAYSMSVDVIYEDAKGGPRARAILPTRESRQQTGRS